MVPGRLRARPADQHRDRGRRTVTARYSNGPEQAGRPAGAGQLPKARRTCSRWATTLGQTFASGPAVTGVPNEGNMGVIQAGALEESNVDLTGELVSMITAQRVYQTNAAVDQDRGPDPPDDRQPPIAGELSGPRRLPGDERREGRAAAPGRAGQQPGECLHARLPCRAAGLPRGAGARRRRDDARLRARVDGRPRRGLRPGAEHRPCASTWRCAASPGWRCRGLDGTEAHPRRRAAGRA